MEFMTYNAKLCFSPRVTLSFSVIIFNYRGVASSFCQTNKQTKKTERERETDRQTDRQRGDCVSKKVTRYCC